jgi:alpha-glucosidase
LISIFGHLRTTVFLLLLTIAGYIGRPVMALSSSTTALQNTQAEHSTDDTWWKHAVIYEIYPRSFQDSDGDGVGDLNGITQRLDYLKALGVDAIWLSPVYPSPQVDFGYDISNYKGIDPQYGTLADFNRLVAEAKKRNIRIIMDFVMNHTSDKHPWFVESRSSRTNPKRDWYIWKDGRGEGIPPNNWESVFGHSAWKFDPKTNQWYYHKFYPEQPDLNWRNPAVEKAMFDVARFWLDRGVAGFRLDAVPTLFEDPQLRDERVLGGTNAYGDPIIAEELTSNLPEVHGVMQRLRSVVDQYPGDRVLIGETYLPNIAELDRWYGGAKHDELQLPMDTQVGFIDKLDVNLFRQKIQEAENQINGNQPLFVFSNHDKVRSWERYGDGVHNDAIARLIATMLFTTRSTALMYYGEELGMVTSVPTRKEDVKDPIGIIGWPKEKGRDGERTPMQWNDSRNADFSTAQKTWLPVAADYKTVNVQEEMADPNSLLNWYKRLIELRRTVPALRDGSLTMLDTTNSNVLSYLRKGPAGQESVLVALNFTAQPQTISFDLAANGVAGHSVQTVLTNDPALKATSSLTNISLAPFATWIGSVK